MSPEYSFVTTFLSIVCLLGGGLIFLLFLGAIVVYLATESSRSSAKLAPIEHPWARLARQHQLNFEYKPGLFGLNRIGPTVTGVYRSHEIQLELVTERNQQNTTLNLLANPTSEIPPPAVWPAEARFTLDDLFNLIAPEDLPDAWRGMISIELPGHQVTYQQGSEEKEVAYLEAIFDLACDVIEGYPQVIALGGVTIPALTELAKSYHPLQPIALRCLYRIGQETWERLGNRQRDFLCPNCLARPAEISIQLSWIKEWGYFFVSQRGDFISLPGRLPWEQQSYYGCRQCGQSQQFLKLENRQVVVVLDETMTEYIIEQPGQLRINWFTYPQPFDFDKVEIIQADDEAVERFAVQLGNDTDPVRRPRYRQMRCRVAADCALSANTLKILRRAFREVGNSTPDVALLSAPAENRLHPGRAVSSASKPGGNVTPPRAALDAEEFGVE